MALKQGKNVVFNAYIYYPKLKNPALRYGLKPASTPHGNREYVVDVLIEEDDYKKLKKKYKTVKSIKDAQEFDATEFEERYKVAPPYEAETYFIVKFKKSADYKDGNPTTPPVVRAAKGCGQKVTIETEIGNGTQAHIQWKEREWTYEGKKGLSLDLAAVGVKNLIEYEGGELELEFDEEDEFDDDGIEFEEEGGDDVPFDTNEEEEEESW